MGEVIVETLDYDGGRRVAVYRPSHLPEAVVCGGDGELLVQWASGLEAADLPPVAIVGVYRTSSADEMDRLKEYSPVFDATRFSAHERFFAADVPGRIRTRFGIALPVNRTVVAGVSASAEFSLAMGLRHPDRFGTVFSASPGAGYRPPEILPLALPRTYLTAGTSEPFFMENAARWAKALKNVGAEVVFTNPPGGHGDAFWRDEFLKMLGWVFGRKPPVP